MKIAPWKEAAASPPEVRAAKLISEAARLPVPPPPEFSTLATSPAAKALAKRAVFKATAPVLIGTALLLAAWRGATFEPPQPAVEALSVRSLPRVEMLQPAVAAPSVVEPIDAPPARNTRVEAAAPKPKSAEPSVPNELVVERVVPRPSTLGEEAKLLASALQAHRQEKDPARALTVLAEYHARFPQGVLRPEALLAQAQAERALHHPDAALALLDAAGPTANARLAGELQVTRGELLSELESCEQAEVAFSHALELGTRGLLAERAAWGRARCAARRLAPLAGPWLRAFLEEYPESAQAQEAHELLLTLPSVK